MEKCLQIRLDEMLEGLVPMEHKMELINLLNPTTSKFFAHHF